MGRRRLRDRGGDRRETIGLEERKTGFIKDNMLGNNKFEGDHVETHIALVLGTIAQECT
jgi:hypothetical protein